MPVGDRLAREHRVRLHDAAAAGVLVDRVDEVLQECGPLDLRALGDAVDLLAVAVLQHRDEQALLAAEVVQHAGVGHAGLLGHLDEGALVVATRAEHLHRRLQHGLAALGRALLRSARARRGGPG